MYQLKKADKLFTFCRVFMKERCSCLQKMIVQSNLDYFLLWNDLRMSNKFKPLLLFACTVHLIDHMIFIHAEVIIPQRNPFFRLLTFKQCGGYLNFSACIMKNVNIIYSKKVKF